MSKKVVPADAALEALRGRVEDWRRSEGKSKAMPSVLWDEAAAAAGRVCASRVARSLKVN